LSVLQSCAECKAGGDQSLLFSVYAVLIKCCADPLPLARRLALQGIPLLADCNHDKLHSNCASTLSALIAGVEDEQCSAVSLTALKGLVYFLPKISANHIHPIISSLALKVRPFFESSSDDHRASAISVYCCLAKCSDGEERANYLEYAQSILVPILMHSTSEHLATKIACLETLLAIAKVTQFQPLISNIEGYQESEGFSKLISLIVASKCGSIIEMYPTAVANAISYFKSNNPMLRSNVVAFMAEVLCYSQKTENERVQDELFTSVIQGMVDLLKDSDVEVRRIAAENLGRVSILPITE